jgi:hypothetical protein
MADKEIMREVLRRNLVRIIIGVVITIVALFSTFYTARYGDPCSEEKRNELTDRCLKTDLWAGKKWLT